MIFGALQRHSNASTCEQLKQFYQQGGLTTTFPAQTQGCWSSDSIFLAQQHAGHLPAKRVSAAPEIDDTSGCVISFWGRIDNRKELITALNASAQDLTDAGLVLAAWLRWKRDAVLHLVGDFVFAIVDPADQCLFCARDHLGVRPFYYQLSDRHFVFASSLLVFQGLDCCDLSIEQRWLAESLMGVSMSFDKTPYQQIFKLAPGHSLYVDAQSSVLSCYYQMSEHDTLQLKDPREYLEMYQAQLEEAVRCRVVQDDPLRPFGSELSGGIDSSTTTVYAAEMLSQPATQLHGFAFAGCELEPEYIHAVSQVTPMAATHVMGQTGVQMDNHNLALSVLGYPEEHGNGSGHLSIYQLAQQLNIRTLLSGFGGDEFVTTYSSLTLTELYNQKQYRRLLDSLPSDYVLMRVIKLLRLIQRQRRGEQQRQINPRFLPGCQMRWDSRLLKDQYLQQYPLQQQLFAQARYDAGYSTVNAFTVGNRWAPFVPTRMENCTLMAATHQVEYRWPLLDVRLINLFLSIPSTEKFYRQSRWLHRRAIDAKVPAKVTWKRGKDMGPALAPKNRLAFFAAQQQPPKQLHPMLEELVDQKRLQTVIADTSKTNPNDVGAFFKMRSVRALLTLDRWLKQVEASA